MRKHPPATGFYASISWSDADPPVATVEASCGLCGARFDGIHVELFAAALRDHSRVCNTAVHGEHDCFEDQPRPKVELPPTIVIPPANETREIVLALGPVQHVCAACKEPMEIAVTDPHWSTGRGPVCPKSTKGVDVP